MKKITLLSVFLISIIYAASATTLSITVQNFMFAPNSATVNLGDTIRWVWLNGAHTTTSTTIPAGAATWDSPMNSSVTTFTYVPAVTGIYNYQCNFHVGIGMIGNFTVVDCSVMPHATISAGGPITFCTGGSVLLSSSVSGSPTAYQWKKSGNPIAGATSPTYTAAKTGNYKLTITNGCGTSASSNQIFVTVNPKPNQTVTPAGTTDFCPPATVLLTCSSQPGWTFQWLKGTAPISGATNPTFTATKGGNYKCQVTISASGCSKNSNTATLVVSCRTMLSMDDRISISPNPSNSDFKIDLGGVSTDNLMLRIIDETGRLISSQKINESDFMIGSDLKAGIYFLEISGQNNVINRTKLIKTE